MSDHWISAIPRDPDFVPGPEGIRQAAEYFRSIAPECDEVTSSVDQQIMFRDCGENLETIKCPKCGAVLDNDWWEDWMSQDGDEDGYRLARMPLPCCGTEANLNELVYSFDQGFSRFIVEAMNPNIGTLSPDQVRHLAQCLGTNVKIIYQHI